MKKYSPRQLVSAALLLVYSAILLKVMVFKDVPLIRAGSVTLNFGGTQDGQANLLPFTTIVPYLFGDKGWIIAGINLVGNIILLIPLGFLVPLVLKNISWQKSLLFAVISSFAIEGMQTLLRVGIFDIDDVILNALGFMMGYGAFLLLRSWLRSKKYIHILVTAILIIGACLGLYAAVASQGRTTPLRPRASTGVVQSEGLPQEESAPPHIGDPCGGTGGIGEITGKENNAFLLERQDGSSQKVYLAEPVEVRTSQGAARVTDVKIGDRVTLVGGPNPDGSFTADTVVVCQTQGI